MLGLVEIFHSDFIVYILVKTHWAGHLKWVHFTLSKWCFNKIHLKNWSPLVIKITKKIAKTIKSHEECLIQFSFYLTEIIYYSSPFSYGRYKILNCSIIKFKESANFDSNTTMNKPFHINKFKLYKGERGINCPIFIIVKIS